MTELRGVSLHIEGKPKTTAPLTTVQGAQLDGGQVVIRRQVREGFYGNRPYLASGAGVEIVCPSSGGSSLLSVLKNIIDGLDDHDLLDTDRNITLVKAAFSDGPVTTVVVTWPSEKFAPGRNRKYPSGAMDVAGSETFAVPTGVRPLIASSGEAVSRRVDAYVSELLVQWDAVAARLPEELTAAVQALPHTGPYRLTVEVQSTREADLENVVARAVHLLHVGAYCADSRDPFDLWNAAPALEDQVVEVEAYRAALLPTGMTVTLTHIEDTNAPLIDTKAMPFRNDLPLPQIESARDSERLGRRRRKRGPI